MNILVAEDDVTSRMVLSRVLTKWGYEVEAVKDGNEALEAFQKKPVPKLAILDWMMPGLDGVEVCRKVRQLNLDHPPYIILLTALGEKENIVAGLNAGANDYVRKPFDRDELLARLRVGERVIELQTALLERVKELQKALEHVKTLQGILPICMHCHKIRNDDEAWERVDMYVEQHSDAQFSHSICPECLEKYYPEKDDED
ncbi:MAG TPA: response regulator transcription factor [Bacteroidetes bacterium]|nr:response regulator transcription factor [Bacteroidota bacterium]